MMSTRAVALLALLAEQVVVAASSSQTFDADAVAPHPSPVDGTPPSPFDEGQRGLNHGGGGNPGPDHSCFLDANGNVVGGANCPECWPDKCCLAQNTEIYRGTTTSLSCGANALDFLGVSGLTVSDPGAYQCNCGTCGTDISDTGTHAPCPTPCTDPSLTDPSHPTGPVDCNGLPFGTFYGACRGSDDNANVSFKMAINVKNDQNDVALYIATDGGDDIVNGPECAIAGMTQTGDTDTDGNLILQSGDGDACLDFRASGRLNDLPFNTLVLSCKDTEGDGLLDFKVGASYTNAAVNDCTYDPFSVDATTLLPTPDQSSKCWTGERISLDIYVPPRE